MSRSASIDCLFLDIGGVLLTDGWGHKSRKHAARDFGLEPEVEDRHRQAFDTHQLGLISLDDYLAQVVFYRRRPFTRAQFRRYMLAQSKPYPLMLDLVARLKRHNRLKVVIVSNESRELNAYRIAKFRLDRLADFFISSCFVRLLKPDPAIYRLALDVAQIKANRVVYIENTPMFVDIARTLGIQTILHTDYETTTRALASMGLDTGSA